MKNKFNGKGKETLFHEKEKKGIDTLLLGKGCPPFVFCEMRRNVTTAAIQDSVVQRAEITPPGAENLPLFRPRSKHCKNAFYDN